MKIPRGFQMNFAIMGTHVESRCSWTGVILAIFCVIHITPIVLDDLSVLRRFVFHCTKTCFLVSFCSTGMWLTTCFLDCSTHWSEEIWDRWRMNGRTHLQDEDSAFEDHEEIRTWKLIVEFLIEFVSKGKLYLSNTKWLEPPPADQRPLQKHGVCSEILGLSPFGKVVYHGHHSQGAPSPVHLPDTTPELQPSKMGY